MKANELIIGNLVQFEGEFHTIASIGSDETIRLRCEDSTHKNYCHGTIGCYGVYSIDPIPLTEEWLVKFGIKDLWIKESWKVVEDTSDGETFGWSMVVRNACYTKKIEFAYFKYVHQLQNLYFSLTGEELTIGGQDE